MIVCPPFTLLEFVKDYIGKLEIDISVGAQDISPFGQGASTGEVSGAEIKEFADYVIIGHSERREKFNEDDELLTLKLKQALSSGLTPIFCVSDENQFLPLKTLQEESFLVAYEPISAIGTGNPDTPQNASRMAEKIKGIGDFEILYGGSVNEENVSEFTRAERISGVLVGGASLSAIEFLGVINNG
ncbi:MAG: triosephosphate isomerase [Candidatus Levybacteria bacterium]|nr:triosephosphate isomerase [Candidatus Levybacteria bacterium]